MCFCWNGQQQQRPQPEECREGNADGGKAFSPPRSYRFVGYAEVLFARSGGRCPAQVGTGFSTIMLIIVSNRISVRQGKHESRALAHREVTGCRMLAALLS